MSFIYARKLAWKIIKDYNLKIPIDLDYLLEKLNIDIEYAHLPEKVDGIALAVKETRGLIVVNRNRPDVRKRFTIAHEIGHILRHHPRLEREGEIFLFTEENSNIYEREADVFAAELLMPRQKVISAFHGYSDDIQVLADLFQVSKRAMRIRLEELKLILPVHGISVYS
ncbi:ImmA/IrrE family metallo-endopeptidase [Hippea maritima]|uniref:IrrE N-terminal-like domain-containing protein n=1 Tax=Hippea maritima (strain ATCC 700847 / DSM 10411 / MH2) TaxID=760142 RepID=F2LV77_HIPMA|nr:ImmA/IrrE family metallo-endopeptidase [Hippea maritima]AEA33661.1 protein of unknown function DUF955 [Hippea maritima DSM 10411]